MLNEENLSLLVADEEGRVLQLSFDFQGNLGKILKDYGKLGMGEIFSSCWLGNIAVFGGGKRIAFINTQKREFMGYSFDLAPHFIDSIQLCWSQKKSQPKALLMVSGLYYDYNRKTDVVDVTKIFPKELRNKMNQNMLESNRENSKTDKILDNQYPVKPMQLSPEKLNKIKNDLS